MAKLWPLESKDATDTETGGVLVEWPSGHRDTIQWRQRALIDPLRDAAQDAVVRLVDHAIKGGRMDDVNRTNIPSIVAAVAAHMRTWNQKRHAAIVAGLQPTAVH